MHHTYVPLSDDQGRFYTGYTGDLRKRLREHHRGRVQWTASRQPVRLVDYEACLSREDALRRERSPRREREGQAPRTFGAEPACGLPQLC